MKRCGFIIWGLLAMGGCAGQSQNLPPATRPALTSMPAEQAKAGYWLAKPAVASVTGADFYKLWQACVDTVRFDDFDLDRQDFRLGVITTYPMVSKQMFEVWRSDAGTFSEAMLSTLQTVRRTIRFDVTRTPDGSYVARPKVLVEQASHEERRITSAAEYTVAFTPISPQPTRTTKEGAVVPTSYWYAIGRDEAMERQLANAVRDKLRDP